MLMHGWGGSSKSLEGLQRQLAGMGFQVFNIDLPGFGESTLPKESLVLDDYVDFIRELIEKLNIYKPVLIGHSFGGKIALAFAIKYPGVASKLVLVAASGIYPKNSVKKSFMYLVAKILGAPFKLPPLSLVKPMARRLFYKLIVGEQDYLKSAGLTETFKNIISEHLNDKLKLIQTDSLLIWGTNDSYTPLWQGEEMARLIKGSRLEVVQDATHSLPLTKPDLVAKIIYTFLNS